MEIANVFILGCLGYTFFNLGQCYAIMKSIKEQR